MSLYLKILFLLLSSLVCFGCASTTKQTDAFLAKPTSLPESYLIENVPFIEQEVGHCGPATLTMVLNWAGKKVSVDDVATQVYTPGAKGSFQTDMISASRRQGMMAMTIEGLEALLTEVAAGHPVIVFENLSVSWLPQWHYAVVFGYDLPRQKAIMHSGPEASKQWDLRVFERSWKLGNYWGLVVLEPGQLAATVKEGEQAKAAAALEQIGKFSEAEKAYGAILKRWPDSLGAKIGLANIAFASNQKSKAAQILKSATKKHPLSAPVWHNLAIAQGAINQKKSARNSAKRALDLASPEQKSQYQESLKVWLTP